MIQEGKKKMALRTGTSRLCIECQQLLARLDETTKGLHSSVTQLSSKVGDLSNLISGNGHPGMNERLRLLEAKNKESRRTFLIWFDRVWKVVVSIGVGILLAKILG